MQARAAEDLRKRSVTDALVERRACVYERRRRPSRRRAGWRWRCMACRPRAAATSTRGEEEARASARPKRRSQGFLKSAGLTSLDQAKIEQR